MKTSRIQSMVVTLIVTAVLSGGARNRELLKSFEDVSSGHTRQGQFKIAQNRAMSINGQMPFTDIGSAFYYRPGRGNLASVGVLWNDDPGESYRESYELVQTYAPTAKKEKIQELRDTVLKLTGAVADVVVQVQVLEAAKSKLDEAQKEVDKANEQLEKEKETFQDSERAASDLKLKIAVSERQQAKLTEQLVQKEQTWQSLKEALNAVTDASEKQDSQKQVDGYAKELAELERLVSDSKEDQSDLMARLASVEKTASAAENVVKVADKLREAAQSQLDSQQAFFDQAQADLKTAQSESQSLEENAVNLVKDENLFVFRWNADKTTLGSLKLTENMFGNYEKNLGKSGFVIMSGMRSRKLFLSEDDAAKLEQNTHDKHYTEYKPLRHFQWLLPYHHGNSLHIVTHIVETNNEAYVSEQSLKKAADVKLDLKKLADGGLDL